MTSFADQQGKEKKAKVSRDGRQQVTLRPSDQAPTTLRVEITQSGIAKPLSITTQNGDIFNLKCGEDNVEKIWVGASGVNPSNGREMGANDELTLNIKDLNKVYVNGMIPQDYLTLIQVQIPSVDDEE